MEKQRNKKGSLPIGVRIIGIIIAVLAAAYGLYAGMGNSTGNFDGEMQIFALDVGQGDSFFIISPNGKTMLIDSGESSNSKQIEQFIRERVFGSLMLLSARTPIRIMSVQCRICSMPLMSENM